MRLLLGITTLLVATILAGCEAQRHRVPAAAPTFIQPPAQYDSLQVCRDFRRQHLPRGTALSTSGAATVSLLGDRRDQPPWAALPLGHPVSTCMYGAVNKAVLIGNVSPEADEHGMYYGVVTVDASGRWTDAEMCWDCDD